LSRTRSGA